MIKPLEVVSLPLPRFLFQFMSIHFLSILFFSVLPTIPLLLYAWLFFGIILPLFLLLSQACEMSFFSNFPLFLFTFYIQKYEIFSLFLSFFFASFLFSPFFSMALYSLSFPLLYTQIHTLCTVLYVFLKFSFFYFPCAYMTFCLPS